MAVTADSTFTFQKNCISKELRVLDLIKERGALLCYHHDYPGEPEIATAR